MCNVYSGEEPTTPRLGDIPICLGKLKVTELYVFDFDGTLFIGPCRLVGQTYYEKCTGKKWPHEKWLSFPESLLPPMKVKPGPALVDYRRYCGRAGSVTVVLTARSTRAEAGVRTVLEDHQLHPDLLILKPKEKIHNTADYKVDTLASLLKQFPDVTVVKFWDDREENLKAMERFSKQCQNSKIKFQIINRCTCNFESEFFFSTILGSYLDTCGLLPTEEHMAAAQTGIHFIAAQFCAIVGFEGDPCAITLVFGSHALGRTGDVDICLLAPPGLSHTDCIEKLAQQLEKCGVTLLHKGYSTRCPRLKVLLQFKDTPSIDFDIVFAIVSSSEAFSARGKSSAAALTHSDVEKLLSSSDIVSKTAVSGYTLLCKVQEAIRGFIPSNVFGAVVEMTVQVLRAQREKANYYHYIRTFHIVLLLADFINVWRVTNLGTGGVDGARSADGDFLFKQFIIHMAQLSHQQWHKVFEDLAPEHVPRCSDVYKKLSKFCLEQVEHSAFYDFTMYYEDMLMRPAFPPSGYTPVCLVCSGGDHVMKWRLQTLLDAKLPTFIEHLLSSGLDVVLDGNGVHNSFCFAVQETESAQKTVRLVFTEFWTEFSEHQNEDEITIELKFKEP